MNIPFSVAHGNNLPLNGVLRGFALHLEAVPVSLVDKA